MYAIRVNENTTSQVQFRTHPVRSDSNLVGFFIGDNTMKKIPLTQGKYATVDDEDFERLSKYKWQVVSFPHTSYAVTTMDKRPNRKTIRMHRMIMQAKADQEIDHRNGIGLDNRKCNLRFCTHSQNEHNRRKMAKATSKYKGVSWHKYRSKWRAMIKLNYKSFELGHFNNELDAAKTYDQKARELFGDFANLNFPEKQIEYISSYNHS